MTKSFVLLLILTLFLLAACGAQEQTPVSESPAPDAQSQPAKAASTEVPPTKVDPGPMMPTETKVSESGGGVSATGVQMECTLVSDQPEAPAEFVAIFGVAEDDWVIGPENAAVTIVEYSDFQ